MCKKVEKFNKAQKCPLISRSYPVSGFAAKSSPPYENGRMSVDHVSGAENAMWLYRMDAKVENTENATTGQLREMVQNVIIDRFKLKAHRYTEERPGYFLVVAKGGPK